MAQKVLIELIDDIDGQPADETVSFSLDGVSYDIDLATKNAEKLRKALAPYVESARRSGGRKKTAARSNSASNGAVDAKTVRAWAQANGIAVPDRGRIPTSVREQYAAAN